MQSETFGEWWVPLALPLRTHSFPCSPWRCTVFCLAPRGGNKNTGVDSPTCGGAVGWLSSSSFRLQRRATLFLCQEVRDSVTSVCRRARRYQPKTRYESRVRCIDRKSVRLQWRQSETTIFQSVTDSNHVAKFLLVSDCKRKRLSTLEVYHD